MPALIENYSANSPDPSRFPQDDNITDTEGNGIFSQHIVNVANHPISRLNTLGRVLTYTAALLAAMVATILYISNTVSAINKEHLVTLVETKHGLYRAVYHGVCAGLLGGTVGGLVIGLSIGKLFNTAGYNIGHQLYRVGYLTMAGLIIGGVAGGLYAKSIHHNHPLPPN